MVALNVNVTHEHYGSGSGIPTMNAAQCILFVMLLSSIGASGQQKKTKNIDLCFVFMQLAEVDASVSFFLFVIDRYASGEW